MNKLNRESFGAETSQIVPDAGASRQNQLAESVLDWGVKKERGRQPLATTLGCRRFSGVWLSGFLLMACMVNPISPAMGASLQISLPYHDGAASQVVVVTNTIPGKSYYLMTGSDLGRANWTLINPVPQVARTNYCQFDVTNDFNAGFFQALELDPAVAVTADEVTTQLWLVATGGTNTTWEPATLSCVVSNTQTIITLGTWWDGYWDGSSSREGVMPTDSNGTLSAAMNLGYPANEDPLLVQVTYEASPNAGLHEVTPGGIWLAGDGYFVLAVANGLATNSPVADVGHARIWHPEYGPGDPQSIQSISVATDGSAARVGDLAVAIIGQDNYEANNQMSLPPGWTSLGVGNDATDEICYRACYKIVTAPGRQSISCDWVSTSCFVAEAAIVIFNRQ
jgi:hypothetical protein